MKRLLHLGLATLVVAFVAIPAVADSGKHGHRARGSPSHVKVSSKSSKASVRSNKGGKVKGRERAEEVQEMNKRADARRGFSVAPGVENAEGKHATKKTVKAHKKGHTHNGKKNHTDQDDDRD